MTDAAVVQCARLILEAGPNHVTVPFHPRLTVVAGVGRAERESLVGELIGALVGGRGGAHLEVVDATGRHLAVVRPPDGDDRVIDLAMRTDVTEELRGADGGIDLLARLGVPRTDARRRLRLRADGLQVEERGDDLVVHLAGRPQQRLWRAATNVRDAEAWVAAEAERAGAAPEDAEVVTAVELRHRELEAAEANHEKVRHLAIFVGAACALGAVPAALLVRWTALPFVLVAMVTTGLSIIRRRQMVRARVAERRALEQAGAASYGGFNLQRVNAMLAGTNAEHRLAEAAEAHRQALLEWRQVAGDVDTETAVRLKSRVSAAIGGIGLDEDDKRRPIADGGFSTGASTAALARALTTRLAQQSRAGAGCQPLPLVLDEPFEGLSEPVTRQLLELVLAAEGVQVLLLTENETVTAWAHQRAATGRLAVLSPTPDPAPAPSPTSAPSAPPAKVTAGALA